MNNLFFITSPLQLINATEAKEYFRTKNNILVVIFTEYSSKNRNQISNLINEAAWDKVIRFDLRNAHSKTTFFQQIKLVKMLSKHPYEHVFCGNLSSIGKMIIANVSKKKVFLLDDGAVTINHYLSEIGQDQSKPYSFKKQIRNLRFNIFGLNTTLKDSINLFTSYHFKPRKNEQIVFNDLSYFKNTFLSHTIPDETVYLLGQPLADIQLISHVTYIDYIQKILRYYEHKIIYIPHRAEIVSEDLKALQNDHFTIQDINQPIELEFISLKKYPKQICSFYSSALFTLNILYPESKITAFEIEMDKMVNPRPEIKNVYDYTKSATSIHVISLKNL